MCRAQLVLVPLHKPGYRCCECSLQVDFLLLPVRLPVKVTRVTSVMMSSQRRFIVIIVGCSDIYLEVVELEGFGLVGVEVISNKDGSHHHYDQQHHANAHPRLMGHVHLWTRSEVTPRDQTMGAVDWLNLLRKLPH